MAIRLNIKGIASYPHLFTAHRPGRPGQQQGDPKYSVVTILDDDNNWQEINGALEAEKASGFPNGWPANGHWPLKQFTEQDAPKPELVGKWYMNASSAERPPVVDHNVMPITDESQIYPGCKVIVAVAIASYNNVQRGVGCFLNAVQKIGEGPRLDDRPSVNQMFTTQNPQNANGYNPGAFPSGTPQNPGPQGGGGQMPGPQGGGGQMPGPQGGGGQMPGPQGGGGQMPGPQGGGGYAAGPQGGGGYAAGPQGGGGQAPGTAQGPFPWEQ